VTYTAADAEPVLQALLHLKRTTMWVRDVELVGSVARFGSSEKDVDILLGVKIDALGLTEQQAETSDFTWPEIDRPEEVQPPTTWPVVQRVRGMRYTLFEALTKAGCRNIVLNRDIVNAECIVGGRKVPTDVFLSYTPTSASGRLLKARVLLAIEVLKHNLGEFADIFRVDPGAELQVDDILVQRQGSEDTVGTVLELVREPHRLERGSPFVVRLRPLAKQGVLLPSYLYYVLQAIHQQGYYRPWARGSIRLQGIPKAALVQLPLQR